MRAVPRPQRLSRSRPRGDAGWLATVALLVGIVTSACTPLALAPVSPSVVAQPATEQASRSPSSAPREAEAPHAPATGAPASAAPLAPGAATAPPPPTEPFEVSLASAADFVAQYTFE